MTEPDKKPSLEKNVMDAIHSGRVHMRPRWKFVLSGTLAALGLIILVLTMLFIASFAIFTLRESGALFVPVFGMGGVFAFFAALPLVLIILLVLFVIILEILVRRYRVGYRTPLLVSVAAILIVVVIGGYAVERTRVHEQLFLEARGPGGGGLPPPIALMYRNGAAHAPNIHRGDVVSMIPGGFILVEDNGAGTTSVFIDPSTSLPLGSGFEPGQEVVVFGQESSGTVHALGVREIDKGD